MAMWLGFGKLRSASGLATVGRGQLLSCAWHSPFQLAPIQTHCRPKLQNKSIVGQSWAKFVCGTSVEAFKKGEKPLDRQKGSSSAGRRVGNSRQNTKVRGESGTPLHQSTHSLKLRKDPEWGKYPLQLMWEPNLEKMDISWKNWATFPPFPQKTAAQKREPTLEQE